MQEHSKECYGCSRATAKMPREALHHGRDLLPGTTNGMTHGREGARGDPEDPSFTRIRSHVRRQCEQFSDGTAATDGGDLGDPQGGCGSPEDRATSQEDRAQGGREDLFDGLLCGGRPLKQGDQSERAVKKQATFEGLVLSPVDVSEKWEPLPMPKARQLAWQAESLVTSTFESLVSHDRVQILEVACSPNSILSETMRELTGSDRTYKRCSLFNEYDLGTNQGIRKVIHEVDVENPKHVWLSPVCGPFSVMQNINQRTPEQREALQAKRQEAMKHYVGCSIIYTYCVQKGIEVTWEWSQSCQAWRLPLIQKLVEKHQPYFSIVRGCQVGLKTEQGEVISKGKLMTTSKLLAKRMDLPCRCPNPEDQSRLKRTV